MHVAFWSNFHGRGTTSNCIATALNFSLNYNARSLIMHTQYIRSTLESAFYSDNALGEENILKFSDTGIDSLERLIKAGKLTAEDFSSYCNNIVEKRLDILTGSKKTSREIYSSAIGDTISNLLKSANAYYDAVFVDINSGMEDKITQKVIKEADILIVNLEQNEYMIKDFFENYYPKFRNKKMLLVISKYDDKSKCSKKYINFNYDYTDDIFAVPYSVNFLDAMNDHSVKKFFYANNKCVNKEVNSQFFREVSLISDRIFELSNFSDIKRASIGSNNVSTLVKNIFKVG